MNLDNLQFKASVRSGWQAIDLGFLMARAWWRPLFISGALPATLLFLPLLFLLPSDPVWAVVIIWWLAPFWERLPLYFASRKIFGEIVSQAVVFSQLKSLYLNDAIPWLLWRRFGFQRAFDAPVSVLEQLRGSPRSARINVLHGKYSDVALWNQFVCFLTELIFFLGMWILVDFFIPEDLGYHAFDVNNDLTLAGEWLIAAAAFFALIFITPFHAMAGFALYLNRRIELEAWDIEITFRNLAQRKRRSTKSAAALLLATLMASLIFAGTPSTSYATARHDKSSARTLIAEVLQGEAFGQEETERKWRFKNWYDDWYEENQDTIPEWIIEFIEWWENNFDMSGYQESLNTTAGWIKIVLIIVFITLFAYLFYRFREPLKNLRYVKNRQLAPRVMFGLDVTPESLPEDVPAQAMSLWHAGRHRDALSLLYRASLSRLIERYQFSFRSSHTEAECAALVRAHGFDSLSAYFAQLTGAWRRLAYGHQLPENSAMENLCSNWSVEMSSGPG